MDLVLDVLNNRHIFGISQVKDLGDVLKTQMYTSTYMVMDGGTVQVVEEGRREWTGTDNFPMGSTVDWQDVHNYVADKELMEELCAEARGRNIHIGHEINYHTGSRHDYVVVDDEWKEVYPK